MEASREVARSRRLRKLLELVLALGKRIQKSNTLIHVVTKGLNKINFR